MHQRWEHLLFLHWAWDPAEIQRTLPAGLTVDTFGGRAWLGLVPFFMRRVRPAGSPAVPWLSNFLELNVRTYVHDARGRPGVWFYSLDCNRWAAVRIARRFFHLPYEHAAMSATFTPADGMIDYTARRTGTSSTSRFRYRSHADGSEVAPGTLEFFLVERYTLYAFDPRRQGLFSGRVAHDPYRVMPADTPTWDDVMVRLAGFEPQGRAPDHACSAAPVDVAVFGLEAAP